MEPIAHFYSRCRTRMHKQQRVRQDGCTRGGMARVVREGCTRGGMARYTRPSTRYSIEAMPLPQGPTGLIGLNHVRLRLNKVRRTMDPDILRSEGPWIRTSEIRDPEILRSDILRSEI